MMMEATAGRPSGPRTAASRKPVVSCAKKRLGVTAKKANRIASVRINERMFRGAERFLPNPADPGCM